MSYQTAGDFEGIVCKSYSQKPQEALNLISYRGALLSTLLQATVYMFLHNLLNVLVQIANKMGLQKKLTTVGAIKSSAWGGSRWDVYQARKRLELLILCRSTWLRHYAINRHVAGSIPYEVIFKFT
jgi:hypothetical protein